MAQKAAARAMSEVRFRADKDGCLPPAGFAGAVTATWKKFREEGGDALLTVLQLDLDGLHELNTKAGHAAGDAAIGAVVATLSGLRKSDGWTLGRLGGDEFALLAPGVPLEAAFLRAERLRADLDAALARAIPKGQRCTVSIGVASLPRDGRTPDDVMRKADLALYAAKEQGGDTVSLTPGDEMVLKSSYYTAAQLGRLRSLAERRKSKEAVLLREALDDLLRKYDRT
jgi:diguanylate cyclase (GGDEF)-like protein